MKIDITKVSKQVDVAFEELPEVSREYIINYGLKQVLNDCISGYRMAKPDEEPEGTIFDDSEEFAEAVMETVQAKLEALQSGEVTRRSGGSRAPADPVGKEAYRLAQIAVKAALAKKGIPLNKLAKGQLAEFTQQHLETNLEAYREEAAKNLEAIQEFEVDLGEVA